MWRVGLWTKILLNNIDGEFLNVIRELNLVYFVCYFCTVGLDQRKWVIFFYLQSTLNVFMI